MSFNDFGKVLVLAAHTDDVEFGCGGTVARLLEENREVHYAVFSEMTTSRDYPPGTTSRELGAARKALGFADGGRDRLNTWNFPIRKLPTFRQEILDILIDFRDGLKPDLVLAPSLHDTHQDHHTIAEEAVRAFRRQTLLGYECPWNNFTFDYQAFVRLDEKQAKAKIAACCCYNSQQHRAFTDADFIWGQLRARGQMVGTEYAEAFEVYRWSI